MPFKALGLEHIALQVKDQAASQKFYMDALGCTVDRINPDVPLIQMRFGDHQIDLLPTSRTDEPKDGIHHFCLSIVCEDIEGLRDEMVAKGVTIEGTLGPRHGAFGFGKSLYIVDPDGYVIELKPRTLP